MNKKFMKGIMDWLELPERDVGRMVTAQLYYGADRLVRDYAGIGSAPENIRGYWVHGWTPQFMCVDPDFALGNSVQTLEGTAWVGTEAVASYLQLLGCRARAIGLPIAYLPEKEYQRRRGTLLVMPTHSLEYTKHAWNFDKYAQEIAEIRQLFDEVVVCLHAGCLKNGYWIREFEGIGVPVIEGAALEDRNALERMRALHSQFEYVTTNGFGSHIAYAAAFGAKVSIFGTFCEFQEDDFENDSFYCSQPGLAKKAVELSAESVIRQHLGDFFCHPCDAVQKVEWGLEQIGYDKRISPAEMRRCFGLEWHQRVYETLARRGRFYFDVACRRLLPARLRDVVVESKDPALGERNREFRRLGSLAPGQSGLSVLGGETFHFADAKTFVDEYKAVFERAEMDIACANLSPTIIDWGAGIGVALRYWAKKFPSPEIHVYEPARERGEALRENIRLAPNAQTVVHTEEQQLAGLLDRKVDFMRINVGLAGVEALCRIGEKIKSVQRLFVVCRTHVHEPQQISRVLALLESSGFRYHMKAPRSSSNPLRDLRAEEEADCIVEIWAFRGEKFPRTWPLPAKKSAQSI